MEELAIKIIAQTPATVRRLTSDLSAAQARMRPAAGEWSAVEIVGHLIDKTEAWGERLRRIAVEETPALPGYDQDGRVRERGYQQQSLPALVERLTGQLQQLVAELHELPASAWSRTGLHAERGRLTLGDATRIYAISLTQHVEQLVSTRQAALVSRG